MEARARVRKLRSAHKARTDEADRCQAATTAILGWPMPKTYCPPELVSGKSQATSTASLWFSGRGSVVASNAKNRVLRPSRSRPTRPVRSRRSMCQ